MREVIVVKVGTAVLFKDGGIDESIVKAISEQVADLLTDKRRFVIVTSGAILSGISLLNLKKKPQDLNLTEKQMCAAIGQPYLMALYQKYFKEKGLLAAQLLLTEDDLANRLSYRNVWRTLNALLKKGIVPVINENDAVSVKELLPVNPYVPDSVRFGDNDRLSAIIASKLRAKKLILLTNVDGYYEVTKTGERRLLKEIYASDKNLMKWASGKGELGRGGMKSKLEAAKIAAKSGIITVIANGRRPNVIKDILAGADVGTRILPKKRTVNPTNNPKGT